MKKTFVVFYSVFANLLIVFALSFFGFNLFNEYNQAQTRNDNRFNKMALAIKKIPPECKINSKDFENNVLSAIATTQDFLYLNIKINDENFFNYPKNSEKPSPNTKLITYNIKKFEMNGNLVQIESYMHILRPSIINYYIKISFSIILFVTVLTLILLLIESYRKNSDLKTENNKTEKNKENTAQKKSEEVLIVDQDDLPSEEEIISMETALNTLEEKQEEDADVINTDDNSLPVFNITEEQNQYFEEKEDEKINKLTKNEQFVLNSEEVEEYKHQLEENIPVALPSEEIKPMKIEENQTPNGLFSPLTGFGWESYLNTRLDNELYRATASEIDLSLFVFKLKDIERGSDLCHKVCDYLISEFQFKDMLFEYQDDCLVAVKIGSNIDSSLTFANKLLLDIDNILQGIGKCFIGISSRSIRMINGERIIKEAYEAVKHAEQEKDSPIIAFRVDIDKYRKYVEAN